MTPLEKKEYMRKYREEHKKEIKACMQKYREEHKVELKKYGQAYRQEHENKIMEQKRQYHEKHKEERNKRSQKYRKEHKEELNKNKVKYRQEHKEECNKYNRKYQKEHREELRETYRKYRQENNEKCNKYNRKYKKEHRAERRLRYKNDPHFRLSSLLRKRVLKALKGISKSAHTLELLGCSIEDFKKHLESLWKEGMSWENQGYKGWHIDHIRPCISFNLTDPEQQKQCFHWSNMQPLWAKENMEKGDKWDGSHLFCFVK